MPEEAIKKPADFFSLRKIESIVSSYCPPAGPFDPDGSWIHVYTLFSIAEGRPRSMGNATIRKTAGPKGFSLDILVRRIAHSGFSYFLKVLADSPSLRLLSEHKLARSADDPAYLSSGAGETIDLPEAFSFTADSKPVYKWGLFEEVQRFAASGVHDRRIDLLDENGQAYSALTLRLRSRRRLELGEGPALLRAYELIGHGVLPTVYWIDEAGRLLFVLSGLECYVLCEENGRKTRFTVSKEKIQ